MIKNVYIYTFPISLEKVSFFEIYTQRINYSDSIDRCNTFQTINIFIPLHLLISNSGNQNSSTCISSENKVIKKRIITLFNKVDTKQISKSMADHVSAVKFLFFLNSTLLYKHHKVNPEIILSQSSSMNAPYFFKMIPLTQIFRILKHMFKNL